jgi:hypothetical protein
MFHCYICEKLLIVYVYACFGGSPAGEADKIGKKKLKKILCSSLLLEFLKEYKLSYVLWFSEEHKSLCSSVRLMFLGATFLGPDVHTDLCFSRYVIRLYFSVPQ